jgi:hypothetical protein
MEFPNRIVRSISASRSMIFTRAGSRCRIARNQPASKRDPVRPDRTMR